MGMPRLIAVRLACVAGISASGWACGARSAPAVPPPEPRPAPVAPQVEPEPAPIAVAVPPPAAVTPEPTVPEPAVDPPPAAAPVAADCSLVSPAGTPIRTVALSEHIDPTHAPYPRNDSERFLFRQLYDTLVRVDCDGRLQPGLASSWRLDPTGPTWVLTLDEQARFSDGSPLTTAHVLSGWGEPGRGAALRPWVRRFVRSMVAVNPRVIGITLHDPDSRASLRALANPALAIATRQSGNPWPLGTTGLRVIDHQSRVSGEINVVTIGRHAGDGRETGARRSGLVQFLVEPEADLRDRLDQTDGSNHAGRTTELPVDLLVTRDPAVLSYAATVPAFRRVPLPWLRTHVLLAPAREPPRGSGQAVIGAATRQALATDAVRGEARGARGTFWWELPADCATGVPYTRNRPVGAGVYAKRVVFPAHDPVAGGLAARLVALSAFDEADNARLMRALFPTGATGLVTVGLSHADFERALAAGLDSGYVLALDRRPFGPCQPARSLTSRATWLVRSAEALDAAVVPLVDTRTWAVIRRGRAGVEVEWDGALRLDGVR